MSSFSDSQCELIDRAIREGYGCRAFALSVQKQGKCSPLQEATLKRLISQSQTRKHNWACNRKSNRGICNISRFEAGLDIDELADLGMWDHL